MEGMRKVKEIVYLWKYKILKFRETMLKRKTKEEKRK